MERHISEVTNVSPLVLDVSTTPGHQDEPLAMKRLSKSAQQLPLVGLQPNLSPKQRFRSEPRINCVVVDTPRAKHGVKRKRFKRFSCNRQTSSRRSKGTLRARIAKWVRREPQWSLLPGSPEKPPQPSTSEHNSSTLWTGQDTLPVLELEGEPIASSALGTNVFYFSFVTEGDYNQSMKNLSASPEDGTSVASGEWLTIDDDKPLNPTEYPSWSAKKSVSPSASSEMSILLRVDPPFSEDHSQNSISPSQTPSHSRSCSTSSSTTILSKLGSANLCQGVSRVSSPCSIESSGYSTWSRRSSQGSLSQSDSTYSANLMSGIEDFEYISSKQLAPVRRHRSMNANHIRNASPLVRARSNSMHK